MQFWFSSIQTQSRVLACLVHSGNLKLTSCVYAEHCSSLRDFETTVLFWCVPMCVCTHVCIMHVCMLPWLLMESLEMVQCFVSRDKSSSFLCVCGWVGGGVCMYMYTPIWQCIISLKEYSSIFSLIPISCICICMCDQHGSVMAGTGRAKLKYLLVARQWKLLSLYHTASLMSSKYLMFYWVYARFPPNAKNCKIETSSPFCIQKN